MSDKPNFFDGRTLGAIAVVFAVWMGWQYYMQKKYPHVFEKVQDKTVIENTTPTKDENPESSQTETKKEVPTLRSGSAPIEAVEDKILTFESPQISFDLSSRGMGLRNIRLNNFTDRAGSVIRLGSAETGQASFSTSLIGQDKPIPFEISKIDDRTFIGRAKWGELEITKKMEILAARYEIRVDIEVTGSHPNFIGVSNSVYDTIVPVQGGSFFVPQYERQEFYIDGNDTTERVHITEEDTTQTFAKMNLISLGSQYFTQAYVNRSQTYPELRVNVTQESKTAHGQIAYQTLSGSNDYKVSFVSFMGPKDVNLLKAVDPALDNVINFGFFSWIAKYILVFLKSIYGFVGNWGVAIILLTAAVRILVLPFNIMSYKSMKVMQVLQPQMKLIREQYKDDQQKMNQEIMGLLKNNNANPIGGCLPMLLQFPIFIALYQVLGQSIELYQAPFALWIQDLSSKDPYYVLPVLMGLTLFVQQKITPNTLDPAQARIMTFMPILFTFFMLALPSGLTLYIFVSGVFGVLQQIYFMKFNQVETPAIKLANTK